MQREAFARVGAWLIDVLSISGWVAILAAVGVSLYLTEAVPAVGAAGGHALSFLVLVAPVTLALARFESGPRAETLGKRARRLRVVDVDGRPHVSFGQALLRNALKVAVPWEIGHLVVYGLIGTTAGDSVPAWLVLATAAAYVLPATYVVTLFVGAGRTPYDRLSRMMVIRTSAPAAIDS